MISPYVVEAARRANLIAPKAADPFQWLNAPLYVPAPIPSHALKSRRRIRIIFAVLTVLVIVDGVLAGLSH